MRKQPPNFFKLRTLFDVHDADVIIHKTSRIPRNNSVALGRLTAGDALLRDCDLPANGTLKSLAGLATVAATAPAYNP